MLFEERITSIFGLIPLLPDTIPVNLCGPEFMDKLYIEYNKLLFLKLSDTSLISLNLLFNEFKYL